MMKCIEEKKYQNYLLNLIPIVKKQAYEAKTEANTPREKSEDDMAQGVLMGYYSIITFFKHEAFAFCIDQKELGLAEIKPEMEYVHPTNNHLRIRVMPGKPHSPFPYQQKPYVVQMQHGKALDKFGNKVAKNAPEAHIPLDEFVYKN